MATLSIDRRFGKTAGYNIQWHEGKKRRTIHLGGKRYAKKTAVRLKEIVENLPRLVGRVPEKQGRRKTSIDANLPQLPNKVFRGILANRTH